jgi:hypothetical protein
VTDGIQEALQRMRQAEKGMRDRLRTLQVAQQHGWEVASEVEKQMTGKIDDPILAAAQKVVADRKKSKAKEENAGKAKRGRWSQDSARGRGQRGRYEPYRAQGIYFTSYVCKKCKHIFVASPGVGGYQSFLGKIII